MRALLIGETFMFKDISSSLRGDGDELFLCLIFSQVERDDAMFSLGDECVEKLQGNFKEILSSNLLVSRWYELHWCIVFVLDLQASFPH